MAARHLVVLGCLALLFPLPSKAEFLNEDLVFEDSANPPRWRIAKHNSIEINSLDSPSLEHSSARDSAPGLWDSAVHSLHRLKRDLWDDWSFFGDDKTTVNKDASTTEDKAFTSDPLTSSTLSRDTRSTDEIEEFNKTSQTNDYLNSLTSDDDDFTGGPSGDSSGETPDTDLIPVVDPNSTEDPTLFGRPTEHRVYRVTLTVHEPYHPDLENRNSEVFRQFSERFSSAVDSLLTEISGTHKSGVISIEKSDDVFNSLVTLDISSDGYSNVRKIRSLLQDRITHYRAIGQYTVSADKFSVREFGESSCAPGEITCTSIHTGENCVAIEARCNGTLECQDGQDEDGCPPLPTEPTTTTTTTTTTEAPISEPFTSAPTFKSIASATSLHSIDRCRADDKVRCADNVTFICVDQKCDDSPDCPDGDDELGCLDDNDCANGEFMCDLTRCIPQSQKCDGVEQCNDKTDEQNCQVCKPDEFQCRDGKGCLERDQYCDGHSDCDDGSDEETCATSVCLPDEFQCRDGKGCVERAHYCDGFNDCDDGSDEENCGSTSACDPQRHFECDDKTCIDKSKRCNGEVDCPRDNSDEFDCPEVSTLRKCKTTEFQCRNRMCIELHRRCDKKADCPDNSDEQSCQCKATQFSCSNGHCIESHQRCDGTRQCQDGSDELNCIVSCTSEQFKCREGSCIDRHLQCNRFHDCPDGSDEEGCGTCRTDEFRCNDGSCLPMSVLCNGRAECRDGEDEKLCGSSCHPYEFQCRDRTCISQSKKCDGFPDCQDGTDEEGCGNPVHCMANEFRCNDGTCIQAAYRCDNVTDCQDRSDEQNCRHAPVCRPDQITCGDGSCVDGQRRCDRTNDCNDGADERNCPRPDEFSCDGGRYLPSYKKCDRVRDCADGSDEAGCPPPQCRPDEFSCDGGQCIPNYRKCDRVRDCSDGSDEADCGSRCPGGQFSCLDGTQCVPQSAHCDGNVDCRDRSDEDNCLSPEEDGLNLKTYPSDQIIKESREVVFQCRDEGPLRASVRWTRGNGLPLPPGSRDIKGRLEMPNIQLEHSGTYVCEAIGFSPSTRGSRASVFLQVEHFEPPTVPKPPDCKYNEATCSNGQCILKTQVCDGNYDCTDGSDELRCNPHGCEPNEFRCDNKKCVQKTWRCDSDDDCGDGSDERNCEPSPPGSSCRYDEYQCSRRDQCIPKAFHCDMEVDCQDGSDEFGCSKAEIQKPPPSMVVKQPGDTFIITCTAVGVPTPEVVWRLNWGHIPSKCQTTSSNGYGTLTCPNIQESDQGAYSCEALNNRGSTFAIPDSILVVKSNRTLCSEGSFNELAASPEECISCFCFGVSTSCRSADLFIYQLPPPLDTYSIVNVYVPPGGGSLEIRRGESQFQGAIHPTGRSGFQISLTDNELRSSYYNPIYPYFALPEYYHGNQLKSYGGFLKYTAKTDGTGSPLSIPDVILTGNGYTLVFKGAAINPGTENNVAVRFFPGSWYRVQPDSRAEYPASRQDLMMALQQVEQLLIRTQYFSDGLETTLTDINMDSAAVRNNGQGKAAYVEQCDCPHGYSGLSCEACENGFLHQPRGPWLGTCEPPVVCPPKYYKDSRDRCQPCPCPHTDSHQFGTSCRLDSDMNITCECPPGYEGRRCEKCSEPLYVGNPLQGQACVRPVEPECDPAGSLSPHPDPYSHSCQCKEYATGRTCNQCKPNTFNLASGNQFGCISCFCMGINTTCTSSDLYRTQIVSAFTRDNQGFKLAEANRLSEPITDIQVNPSAQEIYFQQFNPGTYYWVLPNKFLHNKVTSYGGNLRYTLRYIPSPGGQSSPNSAPDVEIVADNEVHLVYYNRNAPQPEPNRPVTVVVPLLEQYWEGITGAPANREQLLMGLAELNNILIKATYTTNTQEAALISVSLDTATNDRNTGQSRAVEVELCNCLAGYRGTSCEECDAGYTRIEEGLYLGTCEPCNCNGFSTDCDPDTGRCFNCRGNTKGEKCDQCIEGYQGDPVNRVPCSPAGPAPCYCDPRGSTSSICDQNNQCICKTNVIGESCSECRRGTYDLSESNIDGCIECFCSGVSSDCQSSNLYREAIPMQIIDKSHKFTLTDPSRQVIIQDEFILNPAMNEIGYDFTNSQRQQRLFWSLPPDFTSNKVLSYGGFLNFTQRYSALPSYPPSFDTDVIIIGSTMSIYWTDEDVLRPDVVKPTSIPLRESKWRRLDQTVGQRPASRADLMKVLANIQAILIRATHSTHTQLSYLSDVSLDTAVSQRTGRPVASEVEVCRCPPGYRGSSCESCSSGHYQDFDNTCKKCPCNDNEEHCALGPQQQVICTCKASYAGTYCEKSINSLMMVLQPQRVTAAVGEFVTFTCRYFSSEKLTIEFTETYHTDFPHMQLPPLSLEFYNWGAERRFLTRIRPQHKMVSCSVRNAAREELGVLSSMIYPSPSPDRMPSPQPTISISIIDPTMIVIEAGNTVTFRCRGHSLVSSRPVGLEWTKENGYLPQGRAHDDKSGMLVIKNVQASDSGTYICTAKDEYSFAMERAVLNVGGSTARPVVTVTPKALDVRAGEPVEFRCEATGVPTPSVQWVGFHSNKLPPQSSFASGVFRIPYASLEDEGQYTCTANNSAGIDSESVSLYVRSVPVPPPPPPRLTIQPQDYSGVVGNQVRLECVASNPRNIRLQWSRQDGVLSPNARDSDGIFTIYNPQPSDSGIYTCTAIERSTGAIQQEVRARISITPHQTPQPTIRIEPPRQTVSQGTIAELRCITSEGPIQWSKAGDQLPPNAKIDGSILRVENVQVRDRGVYVCQVDGPGGLNRITGIIEVERRELPVIELFPKGSQTVIEGGSVLFQCRVVQGIPEPALQWSRVDGTPMSRQVEQLPGGVLRLNSVTRADEGQYMCTADNQEGSATTVAVLEVHSMPLITITPPGQSIKVSAGQRVRLDCRAYGHPQPIVVWSKHQPGYSFYEPKSITPETPQGAVYEIKGATHDDEGSYTCSARNAAGEVQERIQLIVSDEQTPSGPPRGDIPSSGVYIPDDDFTVPLGGHVTIRCVAQGPQQIYIEWVRRDQRPLSSSAQTRDGVLYIQQVQPSDSGDYSCQGIGSRGEVLFSAVAHLRVVEPMQIKLEPERQVVRPGDTARIVCTATGEQPINISWEKTNNEPLPSSVRVSQGTIEFAGIRESDAGRYVCKAQNIRGILEATADVIVNGNQRGATLRAMDRNPSAMEGSSVKLRCDTPDYQEIIWTREYQPLPSRSSIQGPSLVIENLQMEDAGRYICRTNVYGSTAQDYIDLRVERRNDVELRIEPSNREVHYGDTVDLRCLAVGPPNMKLYWSRGDDSDFLPNTQSTGEILRITSAVLENTGTYKCSAFVNNNVFHKEYYLTVRDDRPTHDAASAETVTAEYGQTVNLECAIDLEGPITHTWTKHGGVLPASAQVSGPRLSISSVTYKDAGLYICSATNGNVHADIPKIILVRGAVPFFAQAPYSYLALPTLPNGYLAFNIEITFKPENPNGLILYNGQQFGGAGDFISFGLRDGTPEFRFDVGSGTGIVRGSQPLSLREWHTVSLNRVKKEGTMYVDDNQYYSGNSSGRMQGLDLSQPLYLGGVPDFANIHRQNGFNTGFVGCISRLVIKNKEEIDIMKEQKDSEGVTSCETCAVNPCVNSGVCQEAPTKAGYTCLCPRGFSGLNCSHEGEPCYPGACGAGRCLDTDDGLECYCGLGQAGDRCDRNVSITEPSFSKNSYLAYPTPKTLNKIKISLKFNAADYSNGLLLYCAENDDGTGDFISLSLRDRHLEFKFNSGSGMQTLRSIGEVVPGQWVTVNAGVVGREARLSVTGELPVSKGIRAELLKFTTPLYIGGYDEQRIRPAAGVGVRQGFHGCVSEVQVSGLSLDLIRSVIGSANIDQCSSGSGNPCLLRPCQNNGVCSSGPDGRSYQCSCPTGYSGENCESEQDMCAALQPCENGGSCVGTPNSYKCNCPMGYAGPTCRDKTEFRTEVQFHGDGYVELSRDLLPHTDPEEPEKIHVEFSTREPNGLLLWHGQTPDVDGTGQDYLSLAVVNGHLQLSYELGSKPAFIVSSPRVDDGVRHAVLLKRQGKDGSMELDSSSMSFGESSGLLTQLNTAGNIYIGGLPNMEYMTGSNSNVTGFTGCIHSLQIQNSGVINFAERGIRSVNVVPCASSNDDDYDDSPGRGEIIH